jgi:hypothetical protein
MCEALKACAELCESCCGGVEVITIFWNFMKRLKNSKELWTVMNEVDNQHVWYTCRCWACKWYSFMGYISGVILIVQQKVVAK